jgi:hypothetical protein
MTIQRASLSETFNMLIRAQPELTKAMLDERALPGILRGMLAIAISGLALHGAAVGVATHYLRGMPTTEIAAITGGLPMFWMPFAFVLAFVGALSLALPSFWFHTQLSGLDASFRLCTAQALRAQATTSALLVGTLPIYLAIALAAALGGFQRDAAIAVGMLIPFAAGLYGLSAVHRGFRDLTEHLPLTHPQRGRFLVRLVFAWGAVYSAIAPLALYRLAEAFSRLGA